MTTKLQLPCGIDYGIGNQGEKICRGAKLGHYDRLPDNKNASPKLRLELLRIDSQGYDQSGAYWGSPGNERVYCAWGQWGIPFKPVLVFKWASSRDDAKAKVRAFLPNATFYR